MSTKEEEAAAAESVTLQSAREGDPESPPDYSEAGGDAPPPSYNSMFGKLKGAQEESDGKVDCVRRVCVTLLCGTVCCGIWIAFLLAVPIASLVIGVLFLHQCPRERFIPIYLVVFGCFGIVKALANIVQMCCNKKKGIQSDDPNQAANQKPNPVDSILNCFLMAWFIAGCVWVYRTHGDYQSVDPTLADYCNHTVFMYAFWLQTAQFILMGVLILFSCCMCIVLCCCAAKLGGNS